MKLPRLILLITLSIFGSCNHADINDASKRNENWVWFVDKITKVGKWVPVANETTVKTGDYITFYYNGKVYSRGRLRDKKEVDTTYFYDNEGGIIKYIVHAADTSWNYATNGRYKSYFRTGEIKEDGVVENHKLGNHWIWYYKNGAVSEKKLLVENTGWKMNYYESGGIKDSAHYTNGIQDGLTFTWFENGQLQQVCNWEMYILNGRALHYYANGNRETTCNWINGQPTGPDSGWYDDGKVKFIMPYKDGKKQGESIFYYENGHLKQVSNIKDDVLNGLMLNYYENGQVRQSFQFENGKIAGACKAYYDDGHLCGMTNFTNEGLDAQQTVYYHNGQIGAIGNIRNKKVFGTWLFYDSTGVQVKALPNEISKVVKTIIAAQAE